MRIATQFTVFQGTFLSSQKAADLFVWKNNDDIKAHRRSSPAIQKKKTLHNLEQHRQK